MARDPAVLLYTKDFLSGIQDLTMEERGQYITLLCLQHQKGHLSMKAINLCVGNAAADVMAKFRQDSAGLWYNVRMEEEIEKRAAHGEKQKQRALDGWKKRKNKESQMPPQETGNAAALPLVNANANVDGIEIKLKGAFDEIYLEQQKMKWPHLDFQFEFRTFCEKVRGSPDHYANHDTSGMRFALQSQLRGSKGKINGHSKNGKQSTEELATAFALRVQQDAASKQFSGGS